MDNSQGINREKPGKRFPYGNALKGKEGNEIKSKFGTKVHALPPELKIAVDNWLSEGMSISGVRHKLIEKAKGLKDIMIPSASGLQSYKEKHWKKEMVFTEIKNSAGVVLEEYDDKFKALKKVVEELSGKANPVLKLYRQARSVEKRLKELRDMSDKLRFPIKNLLGWEIFYKQIWEDIYMMMHKQSLNDKFHIYLNQILQQNTYVDNRQMGNAQKELDFATIMQGLKRATDSGNPRFIEAERIGPEQSSAETSVEDVPRDSRL
jgi:hypothetical protein